MPENPLGLVILPLQERDRAIFLYGTIEIPCLSLTDCSVASRLYGHSQNLLRQPRADALGDLITGYSFLVRSDTAVRKCDVYHNLYYLIADKDKNYFAIFALSTVFTNMKKEFTSGESWNSAAIAGLILAVATIAAEFVSALCGKIGGFSGDFLGFIAWAGKLVLCAVMLKFKSSYDSVGYPELQRYGLKLALFSSLVVAAFSLVNILVINPGTMDEITEVFRTSYSSMMDSNAEAALEKMMPKMPYYMAIGSLIYCFIWGWLYATIFAKSAAPDDPFEDIEEHVDDQDS